MKQLKTPMHASPKAKAADRKAKAVIKPLKVPL
jgi:hypothetical protein